MRAHARWRTLRHYDDPVGWMRRVAINLLHDDRRRAARKRRAIARLAAEPEDTAPPPEPDGLAELLAALPRQQRMAVALFYVDGLAVAEVAAAMGLAEGSVKSHLHDARRRLRAVLNRRRGDGRPTTSAAALGRRADELTPDLVHRRRPETFRRRGRGRRRWRATAAVGAAAAAVGGRCDRCEQRDGRRRGRAHAGHRTAQFAARRRRRSPTRRPLRRPPLADLCDPSGHGDRLHRRRSTAPPPVHCRRAGRALVTPTTPSPPSRPGHPDLRQRRRLDHRPPGERRVALVADPVPSGGFSVRIDDNGPDRVRVRFEKDDQRSEIRVDLGPASSCPGSRTGDPTAGAECDVSSPCAVTTPSHSPSPWGVPPSPASGSPSPTPSALPGNVAPAHHHGSWPPPRRRRASTSSRPAAVSRHRRWPP